MVTYFDEMVGLSKKLSACASERVQPISKSSLHHLNLGSASFASVGIAAQVAYHVLSDGQADGGRAGNACRLF
jgi:hypothetical protein